MKTMASPSAQDVFGRIYDRNLWISGSGEGSTPENTTLYCNYLQRFLQERQIRTVVDFGCGDWQFSRLIDWSSLHYLGVDVVPEIIRSNRRLFGKENINFIVSEGVSMPLPEADLLIVKDVLQHWPTKMIQTFLTQLPLFRYALITNCLEPATNTDIPLGGHRGIDLLNVPFYLSQCTKVLTYEWYSAHHRRNFQKSTFLYERGNSHAS